MPLIEARHLTKRFRIAVKDSGLVGSIKHVIRPHYREVVAVDGIDLCVEAGESVAYVGPNGAGKSTTLKMLTGILVPTAGTLQVHGLIPYRDRIANTRRIGVVFGQRTQLWWDLPVWDALRLLGDIYEAPPDTFRHNLEAMVDLLDLGPLLAVPARQLSLGQRMRCDLAAALIHSPSILFLDEPTIGLDVAVKERIRKFIRHQNAQGLTVLLTSHDLADIQDICTRLVMIDKGRIVFDGPLQTIQTSFGRKRVVHLVLYEAVPDAADLAQAALGEAALTVVDQSDPYHLSVEFDATQTTSGLIAGRLLPLLPVNDLHIEKPSLESIIRGLYEGTLQFEGVS